MATGSMEFSAPSLNRITRFHFILPNDAPPFLMERNPNYDRPIKAIYLLHGYSANCGDWMLNTRLVDLAYRYNLAVFCPNGDNSFYLDGEATGFHYATFVGQELVDFTRRVFGLSAKREDTMIGGVSMGGFGALHTALQFPDTFSAVAAFSSALIIYNISNMKPGERNEIANYAYYRQCFGDLSTIVTSRNNPEVLAAELLENGRTIPKIYMAVGTEDFLYQENQVFLNFLRSHRIPVSYHESPGGHDYSFWGQYIEPAIQWMLNEDTQDAG